MDLRGVKELYKDLGLFILGVSVIGIGMLLDKGATTLIKITSVVFGIEGRDIRNIFK